MAAPSPQVSVSDQIRQLNDARKLVLGDVKYYPTVVKSILPIVGPTAGVELRRWGADFLAEAFATPALPGSEKETMQLFVLDTLQTMVETPNEDAHVLRSAIQTAASIYPFALRWIINNSYDTFTWERMVAIKQRILRIWDDAESTVRICCIKFAQRVVLAQSAANPNEPRRGDSLDISLDKIPPNHQTLDARTLDAEGAGLLDRILSILQENSSDVLLVDATLNCLSILIRSRPGTANRILNAVLNFNPLKLANSPMTPRTRVMVKSMEKTTRMLLIHLAKRDPHNPMAQRIQQHVERMMRMRHEIFDESGRKRALEAQQQQEGIEAKRQRMAPQIATTPQIQITPLPPGPHSLGDVFTLTGSEGLKAFDVGTLPTALAAKISITTLLRTDAQLLAKAVEGIRGRLNVLAAQPPPQIDPETAPLGVEEDDDEYEPDFYAAEDNEQILNKLDSDPVTKPDDGDLGLRTFRLPPPPALTPELALSAGQGSVMSLFQFVKTLEDPAKKSKSGINRLAASTNDRESWIAIITRLASRSSAGLEGGVKDEATGRLALGDSIRESLYTYVLEDFRRRIDVAITWLHEEWYNDQLQKKQDGGHPLHYEKWALKLIDGFSQYLNAQDKVITRFLGEIPELSPAILSRVKLMCRDPLVVPLALTSLLYLVMMRPPAKDLALDTVQDIWTEYEDARPLAAKYLVKFRPTWLESAKAAAEAGTAPATNNTTAITT
ncbi:mRNA cleavage and polyadenylation specificity factor complex subunit [Colletotrichum abscissum]|uniref:mRNA cleavage and polyadenylation specificity factor complex subunit n=4 Tax=Colletotrichum acutatum species complex TaxID=2707335 RepID=A0A9P9WZS9_9PEZI|nr:mRNA cleavage and polyadenylation specificity factor complex subunit [Colletotrichum tamarilloi]XP_060396344.1 mRNA cleavage and polyadenylation specificity factor complex subunit [Colletotrichum abscissum]KAK0379903.1 mRNA cleavage and polyadenylation specificity factor complex subunit [Colletotrichum limetticola]KAK1449920.1 mRNA cleavage and polyadenylation specificity factor complex subunit [Colletotrichum melonis]KAK1710232.1 mRNA cleavage and polyadenylation specificity factor complex 